MSRGTDADAATADARSTATADARSTGTADATATGVAASAGERTPAVKPSFIDRLKALIAWAKALQPVRAFLRLGQRDGGLLAAGMAYQSIFAIFAGLWVLFSIIGLWLRADDELTRALIDAINRTIPGLIGKGGAVQPHALLNGTALSWTGAIALVGLLWKAIGWMAAARKSIRDIFDLPNDKRNFVVQKSADLGLAVLFGVLLIASAVVSVASSSALDFVFSLVGVGAHTIWATATARIVGYIIAVALNGFALALMYRVLSQVRIPMSILTVGSLAGGVVLVVMSSISGLLLGGADNNPLLASFVVFVGLLIWFNLICTVILLGAAWIATVMADHGYSARSPEDERAAEHQRRVQARLLLADAAVSDARRGVAEARWPHRASSRRHLRDALRERDRLHREADAGA
ncbi:YihY/virulence factor BrkB family protein [Microbacterium sp. STN6]|uniref:YihY/virulence factor BrkB family protein n=1 Tax=Microbacterium sp. STN6 TaxID=2995588 RepID=UPI0022609B71|nr:YihY/virulence factor BrkB family protein [Microbacterium sp. STN6]MCX7520962.1 YihY/virulence factor BrkB family protein [Microbacterium sp. STN6]